MNKRKFILFSALEITYWGFHAAFVGYASAYVLSRGVSGTVMSLLLSGFLLSAVADRFGVSAMLTLCAAIAVIPALLSMKKPDN